MNHVPVKFNDESKEYIDNRKGDVYYASWDGWVEEFDFEDYRKKKIELYNQLCMLDRELESKFIIEGVSK